MRGRALETRHQDAGLAHGEAPGSSIRHAELGVERPLAVSSERNEA
jgi:hypothetical protein